jgi:peptidyl-prolyl cis-trans isomerase C
MPLVGLVRDRLFWYIVAGVALFAIDYSVQQRETREIKITLPLVEKLAVQWEAQTKRPPSPRDLDMLIEGYIREEVLMREAIALGLDEDDVIIRRRLAQKVEFTLGEGFDAEQPSEEILRQFYADNIASYRRPERLSFRHIFLAEKPEMAAALQTDLAQDPASWKRLGQPFMLQRDYIDRSRNDLAELFGGDFAEALFARAGAAWQGPIQSAYGWHLVQINQHFAAEQPDFELVAERVARDWVMQAERTAKEKAWAALRAKYTITMQPLAE